MSTLAQKAQYLQQVQALMTQIAQATERAAILTQLYTDRQYDTLAEDPVTLPDVESFGVVLYDLSVAVNLMQQLSALMAGQATTPSAAYRVSMNKWRQV